MSTEEKMILEKFKECDFELFGEAPVMDEANIARFVQFRKGYLSAQKEIEELEFKLDDLFKRFEMEVRSELARTIGGNVVMLREDLEKVTRFAHTFSSGEASTIAKEIRLRHNLDKEEP